MGETPEHLCFALDKLGEKFARIFWVPGNHDLYTYPEGSPLIGEARYLRQVDICRAAGVITPEDPFVRWPGPGPRYLLVPMFLLYDYSFRPPEVPFEEAVAWARESGVMCADERLLESHPYPSKQAWCEARCQLTQQRLDATEPGPKILINHYPLRPELVHLRKIPRFCIWCGTTRTVDWHRRYQAAVVISGHLHVRTTSWIDGVRFEEVSLGYPQHWRSQRGMEPYLREILPGPSEEGPPGPVFHGL